jgi:hypothetical protein
MADEKDTLLDDVRAAAVEIETGEKPPAPEIVPTVIDKGDEGSGGDGRERDERGRFASKAEGEKRPTLSLKEPKEKPPAAAATASVAPGGEGENAGRPPGAPSTPQQQPDAIAPPAEWKGAGKVKWDRLPREIQSELRDAYQAVAAERQEIGPLKEMLDLARPTLVREAGSVGEGVRQLLAFHQLSLDKPLDLINHIARSRGIDLRAALAGQPQGTPQGAPDLNSLIEQAVQQRLQPFAAQLQQQQSQPIFSLIESARTDPKFPYFNDVQGNLHHYVAEERAHLEAAGKQATPAQLLEGAYNRAIWANPTIRAQLQAAASEEAAKTRAAEVEAARKARAASLRGSPLPNPVPGGGDRNATVLDDVRAAASELAGA